MPSWTYSWYRKASMLFIFSQFGCFFVYMQLNAGSPVWMRYRGWRQTLLMASQNSLLHVKGQPLLVGQLCPFKVRAYCEVLIYLWFLWRKWWVQVVYMLMHMCVQSVCIFGMEGVRWVAEINPFTAKGKFDWNKKTSKSWTVNKI